MSTWPVTHKSRCLAVLAAEKMPTHIVMRKKREKHAGLRGKDDCRNGNGAKAGIGKLEMTWRIQ